ncbi:hypothetical protein Jann_1291 [Jannaschia sp. CCS1]|nr:hypothetical protein Jann_1291 [Jannaschia sp. CCS1]
MSALRTLPNLKTTGAKNLSKLQRFCRGFLSYLSNWLGLERCGPEKTFDLGEKLDPQHMVFGLSELPNPLQLWAKALFLAGDVYGGFVP